MEVINADTGHDLIEDEEDLDDMIQEQLSLNNTGKLSRTKRKVSPNGIGRFWKPTDYPITFVFSDPLHSKLYLKSAIILNFRDNI